MGVEKLFCKRFFGTQLLLFFFKLGKLGYRKTSCKIIFQPPLINLGCSLNGFYIAAPLCSRVLGAKTRLNPDTKGLNRVLIHPNPMVCMNDFSGIVRRSRLPMRRTMTPIRTTCCILPSTKHYGWETHHHREHGKRTTLFPRHHLG